MTIKSCVTATFWICLLVQLHAPALAEPYGSGWYGELQASFSHEDNLSRSFLSSDEESDAIASVSIGGGHSQKVGNNAQLVFYGYVAFNRHDEFDDLDNIATTVGGTFTHQFNPGFDAPGT